MTVGSDTYWVPSFATYGDDRTDYPVEKQSRDLERPGQTKSEPYDLTSMTRTLEIVPVAGDHVVDSTDPQPGNARRGRTLKHMVVKEISRATEPDEARKFLLGLATIEFAVILLIVTNAAASTVTREKEDGTLDLLLSSPITSRYYIWGKLRGLVSFVLPLVAVPVVSALLFVVYDFVRRLGNWSDPDFKWIVFPEAVLILPGMLIIVAAFAAILGMQMSLRCRTTVMAVMSSVGIVVGVCAAMGFCGYKTLDSASSSVPVAIGAFSPFTLMQLLIDPYESAGRTFNGDADDIVANRVVIAVAAIAAIGAYSALVWSMYQSMVKNFDMTIRRQSR